MNLTLTERRKRVPETVIRMIASLLLVLAAAGRTRAEDFEPRWKELKASLSNEDLYRLLWALPKGGDLHNHHEYSVPMTYWLEGAARGDYYTRLRLSRCGEADPLQWLNLRSDSVRHLTPCERRDFTPVRALSDSQRRAWISALTLDGDEARDEFFERVVLRLGDLERDPRLISDALVVAQRQLQAQNAVYLETQADPRVFTGLNEDEGAEVIRRRLNQKDSAATGVAVRMQVSTVRFLEGAEKDLSDGFAFVHRNRDLWAGVNLVGREDNPAGRPARFVEVMRHLRQQYPDVLLSLHAGESSERDTSVAETLALGASRIGHGTNAHLDPHAMEMLAEGRNLIEVSLISNQQLGYVKDLRQHPFPIYLRKGIPVCLNTDDLGILDSNLTDEYFAAVALFDLTWAEVVRIGRWSLEFSFAEEGLKKHLLERYDANVSRFEKEYSGPDWPKKLSAVAPRPSGSSARVLKLRRMTIQPVRREGRVE
jgi:adenosine deaminase CECR1